MFMNIKRIQKKPFLKTFNYFFSSYNKEIIILEDKIQTIIKNKLEDIEDFIKLISVFSTKIKMENSNMINERLFDNINNFIKININSFDNLNLLNVVNSLENLNRLEKSFNISIRNAFKEKFRDLINSPHTFKSSEEMFIALKQFYRLFTEIKAIDQSLFEAFLRFFNKNQEKFSNEEAYSELIWNITLNLCIINRKFKKVTKENSQIINNLLQKSNLFINNNYSSNTSAKIKFYRSIYYLNLEKFNYILLSSFNLEYIHSFKPFYNLNYERVTTESNLQKKFEQILIDNKFDYIKEFKTDFSVVDFLVNKKFVFEINGPQHYIGISSEMRAQDILKKRVLRLKQYNIKYFSYKDLQSLEYVEKIIKSTLDEEKMIDNKDNIDNIQFKL